MSGDTRISNYAAWIDFQVANAPFSARSYFQSARADMSAILRFFADTPRALATDGTTVYVAAHFSGNQTTAINEVSVCDGFDSATPCTTPGGKSAPGGLPAPSTNASL